MEGTTGASYREKRRKYIELSQGDRFLIRRPGRKALSEMLEIFGIKISKDAAAESLLEDEVRKKVAENLSEEQVARFIDIVLGQCVVKPKIVFVETEAEDELWIEDVDPEDIMTIFIEVLTFLGIDPEVLEELSFRGKESSGPDGGPDLGEVSGEAESAIEGD